MISFYHFPVLFVKHQPAISFLFLKISKVTKEGDGTLTLETNNGVIDKVNTLLWAIGRSPNADTIGLEKIVGTCIM